MGLLIISLPPIPSGTSRRRRTWPGRRRSRPARPDLHPALQRLEDETPVVALLPDAPQQALLDRCAGADRGEAGREHDRLRRAEGPFRIRVAAAPESALPLSRLRRLVSSCYRWRGSRQSSPERSPAKRKATDRDGRSTCRCPGWGMPPTTPGGPFGDGRKCSWPHEKAARGTGPGLPARVINGTRSGRARPAPPD
jgi:hypothetical protein